MVKRIGSQQRKTRHKIRLHYRDQGKIPLSHYFQELKAGDKVGLRIYAGVQRGQPYRRFHGATATVTGKRGFCYEVAIKDGNKHKTLIVHPVHLIKQK